MYAGHMDENWLMHYNSLRQVCDAYIEIKEISYRKKFIMEKINIKYNFLEALENNVECVLPQYLSIKAKSLEYFEMTNFIHTDLNIKNIVVDSKHKLRIIDPDSCFFINSLENFYKCKTKMIETYITAQEQFFINVKRKFK